MKRGLLVLAAAALTVGPLAAGAAALPKDTSSASTIGGFTLQAQAAPVSVLGYEPVIPIPYSPQLDFHLSYTSASMETGPDGAALASTFWPGAAIGTGLPTLTNGQLPNYPIQANARYPGKPSSQTVQTIPGFVMSAKADQSKIIAQATTPESQAAALATWSNGESTSVATITDSKAQSVATANIGNISLLGGIIQIKHITAQTTATATTAGSTSKGTETVTGLSIAGFTFAVDNTGVHATGGPLIPLPGIPDTAAAALKQLGIALYGPQVHTSKSTNGVELDGHALVIDVATAPLRHLLDALPLQTIVGLLPPDAQQDVEPALQLAPRLVFVIGDTTSEAAATKPFTIKFPLSSVLPPPPVAPPPVASSGPVVAGSSLPAAPPTAAALPVVAPAIAPVAHAIPGFGGLSAALIAVALLASLGLGWLVRRGGFMLLPGAFAGCPMGQPRGVPNLREGT